ncbi:hypothetical protein SeLEV6574_g06460 [Synchytrium endobioticum]|uniref:Uncharacterized protein n=1 Tax=Synchytrium endobioticum TaxID=286115 RepID=A0A507CNK8_9FUNG|nr:hypothetical protein SeLEV6574_g06460 [Synchytrium endobioticum]
MSALNDNIFFEWCLVCERRIATGIYCSANCLLDDFKISPSSLHPPGADLSTLTIPILMKTSTSPPHNSNNMVYSKSMQDITSSVSRLASLSASPSSSTPPSLVPELRARGRKANCYRRLSDCSVISSSPETI